MTLKNIELHGIDNLAQQLKSANLLLHDFEGSIYLFKGGKLTRYRQTTLDEYM